MSPLGTIINPYPDKVDVGKIEQDLKTCFPRLWRMIELNPIKRVVVENDDSMMAAGFENGPDPAARHMKVQKMRGSSAGYDHLSTTLYLNGDTKDWLLKHNAIRAWSTSPSILVPNVAQTRRGDFYTALTVHELGHHFSHVARASSELRNQFANTLARRLLVIALIEKSKDYKEWDKLPVRPIVSTYAISDIEEYFAENFVAYWFYPDDLKKMDKIAYETVDAVVGTVLKEKAA